MPAAARRPSRTACATKLGPRTRSPPAKTPGTLVICLALTITPPHRLTAISYQKWQSIEDAVQVRPGNLERLGLLRAKSEIDCIILSSQCRKRDIASNCYAQTKCDAALA